MEFKRWRCDKAFQFNTSNGKNYKINVNVSAQEMK